MRTAKTEGSSVATRLALACAALLLAISLATSVTTYFSVAAYFEREITTDLENELREFVGVARSGGLPEVGRNIERECLEEGPEHVLFRVYNARGRVLLSSDTLAWRDYQHAPSTLARVAAGETLFLTRAHRSDGSRARTIVKAIDSELILAYTLACEESDKLLAWLRSSLVPLSLGMAGLGALVGFWLGERALSGVRRLTSAAKEIAQGRFDRRVEPPKASGREVLALTRSFNAMVEQVEVLMREMREVNDNIAHDLRSPITRMRGMAETLLLESQGPERDPRNLACSVVEECDTLLSMINSMLDIAELDAGLAANTFETVDLATVVREGVELYGPLLEDRDLQLNLAISDLPCLMLGKASILQRALANLLDNAIKHTPAGGQVHVGLRQLGERAELEVQDSGCGIPAEEQQKIFKRFYRCATDRSGPGIGLGLCLVRSIVDVHGGEIRLSSEVGRGSSFILRFPLLLAHDRLHATSTGRASGAA